MPMWLSKRSCEAKAIMALGLVIILFSGLAVFVIPQPDGSHDFGIAGVIAVLEILLLIALGVLLFRWCLRKVTGTGWSTYVRYASGALACVGVALVLVFTSTYLMFGSDGSFVTRICVAPSVSNEATNFTNHAGRVCSDQESLEPLGVASSVYTALGNLSTVGSSVTPVDTTGRLIVSAQWIADLLFVVFFVFLFSTLTSKAPQ
jgi:hypothetical protein